MRKLYEAKTYMHEDILAEEFGDAWYGEEGVTANISHNNFEGKIETSRNEEYL